MKLELQLVSKLGEREWHVIEGMTRGGSSSSKSGSSRKRRRKSNGRASVGRCLAAAGGGLVPLGLVGSGSCLNRWAVCRQCIASMVTTRFSEWWFGGETYMIAGMLGHNQE